MLYLILSCRFHTSLADCYEYYFPVTVVRLIIFNYLTDSLADYPFCQFASLYSTSDSSYSGSLTLQVLLIWTRVHL